MDETQPLTGAQPAPGDATAGTPPAEMVEQAETPPVPTEPVVPAKPGRSRRALRWGIALAVLAIMVGVTAVGAVILTGAGSSSSIQGWLPPGTLAYLEVRTDLPGDQRQNLSDFLAKFPGFKDQAALDQKLDTLFDELFQKADISYTAEIKPWLQGEVGFAATTDVLPEQASAVGSVGGLTGPGTGIPEDGLLMLAATTDPAKAEAWVAGELGEPAKTETYAGAELKIVLMDRVPVAWTTKDKVLFVGTVGTVKAALDTGGKGAVASSQAFKDAKSTASGDYLVFAYLDAKAFSDWAMGLVSSLPAESGVPTQCLTGATGAAPAWLAAVTRVEADALVADMAAPAVTSPFEPANAASQAAVHVPSSTVVYAGSRQVGDALVSAWTELKKQFDCLGLPAGTADQVDQALALVGGVDGLIGWAQDLGIAVTVDGTTVGGGLVLTSADPADPKRTADQLGSLLLLAGTQGLEGLSVGQESYGDGTLYTVKIGSDMVPVTLALTGQRGVLVIGTIDFVKAVVDTTEATSLASVDRYQAAIARAGGDGTGELYVDIAGLRDGVVALLPAEAKAKYDAEIAPYLAPFDTATMVAKAGNPNDTVRVVVTVK
ncbi:MAG: hypothetical protein H6Q36_238 [Chloroflexi bacterium]|nr:hypothetical protein [Chloroflexota bacterium]